MPKPKMKMSLEFREMRNTLPEAKFLKQIALNMGIYDTIKISRFNGWKEAHFYVVIGYKKQAK